jgi:hypothetical protein
MTELFCHRPDLSKVAPPKFLGGHTKASLLKCIDQQEHQVVSW